MKLNSEASGEGGWRCEQGGGMKGQELGTGSTQEQESSIDTERWDRMEKRKEQEHRQGGDKKT
jgi:hypothetical protein